MEDARGPTTPNPRGWRAAWRERADYWLPLTFLVTGPIGLAIDIALRASCATFDMSGDICVTYVITETQEAIIAVLCAAAFMAGILLMVRGSRTRYTHTCAECGKVYWDHSITSERRVHGKPVCSAECAARVEEAVREVTLLYQIAALRTAAARPQGAVTAIQARERLRALSSKGSAAARAAAQEALRELGERQG